MAAHNDLAYLQHVHCKLDCALGRNVVGVDDVGDVPVGEDLTGQSGQARLGRTRVGTADPEGVGRLALAVQLKHLVRVVVLDGVNEKLVVG